MKRDEDRGSNGALVRGLGWFSLGLGTSLLIAYRPLSRLIGVPEHPRLMRALGMREVASGVGILAQSEPAPWLWSRVAGDGMDLAFLGLAAASRNADKRKVMWAAAAVAGVAALDTFCSVRATRQAMQRAVHSVITVNRPPSEVSEFWRDAGNVKRCMTLFSSGIEFTNVTPEHIEWRSADGRRSGSVTLQPAFGRQGTEVRLAVRGGIPAVIVHEDLRRSKRLIETGELPTTEGQAAGPRASAVMARMLHRVEGKEVA